MADNVFRHALRLLESKDSFNATDIFRPILKCLTPEQQCSILLSSVGEDPYRRKLALRIVVKSVEIQYLPCHEDLVNRLKAVAEASDYSHAQQAFNCLRALFSNLSPATRRDIALMLLGSSRSARRSSAYALMRDDWQAEYLPHVEAAWVKHNDPGCAGLLMRHSSDSFLQGEYKHLLQLAPFSELPPFITRLGLLGEECLSQLRRSDAITYCYVMVKLERVIPENKAMNIYKRNCLDERVGLLIWAFGEMKLWRVLLKIEKRLSADSIARAEKEAQRWAR